MFYLYMISSFSSIDHQPLYLRHRAAAGQHLPQKVGRQEVAQHGQPQLHQEELQALAGGQKHAGYCEKGTVGNQHTRRSSAINRHCFSSS